MRRSADRSRPTGLASLWPRWFWQGAAEGRPAQSPMPLDCLDEYLQLLDYLDDLCEDEAVDRVEISSEYLPLIQVYGATDLIRRRQVRFETRGLRITFSPDVPRHSVHLHTKRRG